MENTCLCRPGLAEKERKNTVHRGEVSSRTTEPQNQIEKQSTSQDPNIWDHLPPTCPRTPQTQNNQETLKIQLRVPLAEAVAGVSEVNPKSLSRHPLLVAGRHVELTKPLRFADGTVPRPSGTHGRFGGWWWTLLPRSGKKVRCQALGTIRSPVRLFWAT